MGVLFYTYLDTSKAKLLVWITRPYLLIYALLLRKGANTINITCISLKSSLPLWSSLSSSSSHLTHLNITATWISVSIRKQCAWLLTTLMRSILFVEWALIINKEPILLVIHWKSDLSIGLNNLSGSTGCQLNINLIYLL